MCTETSTVEGKIYRKRVKISKNKRVVKFTLSWDEQKMNIILSYENPVNVSFLILLFYTNTFNTKIKENLWCVYSSNSQAIAVGKTLSLYKIICLFFSNNIITLVFIYFKRISNTPIYCIELRRITTKNKNK